MALNVCQLVEQAITNLYASGSNWPVDVEIYSGEDNEDKTAPCVIVNAHDARDISPPGRVWMVTADIITKQMANDVTSSLEEGIADYAEDLFMVSGSQGLGSYTTNLYVSDVHSDGIALSRTGDAWSQMFTVNIFCKKTES